MLVLMMMLCLMDLLLLLFLSSFVTVVSEEVDDEMRSHLMYRSYVNNTRCLAAVEESWTQNAASIVSLPFQN
jgi:hypothetical protein